MELRPNNVTDSVYGGYAVQNDFGRLLGNEGRGLLFALLVLTALRELVSKNFRQ